MMKTSRTVCALLFTAASAALSGLPRLNISTITVSGLSSGADFAAHFAVIFSDILLGSAIYAGEPWGCAVQRFGNETEYSCSTEPGGSLGPGCDGYPNAATCLGCDAGMTVPYDHCKLPADAPGRVNITTLTTRADVLAAAGLLASTAHLSTARTYLERGTYDAVYLDGAVNKTADFFLHYAQSASQVVLVAHIPHAHAQLTTDPWVSPDSCGPVTPDWAPPGMQNCGYDGAGAALQHLYQGTLTQPASMVFAHPEWLTQYDQSRYFPAAWPALSSYGYVYIPARCQPGGGASSCRLHIQFHGCGYSIWTPRMNTSFVEHTGYNPWADANDMVVLYPQAGGFIERGLVAPSVQMEIGCWDGYGQTGADYAQASGLQMSSIRAMIAAIAGV